MNDSYPIRPQPPQQHAKQPGGAIERVMDAQRVLGDSRMIRTDADPSTVSDEVCQAVIERVKLYLAEKKGVVGQRDAAKAIGKSSTVVSQVLGGTYKGDSKGIVMDLDRWLEQRKQADAEPAVAQFVWTSVAKEIRTAAKMAQRAANLNLDARIALVHVASGIGKTMAAEAIADTEPGAVYVSMDYHAAGHAGVIRRVAAGLKVGTGLTHQHTFDSCVEKLRGSRRLLIVDEIHALLAGRDDRAFHTLRHLHDQTKCPQLWLSTVDLMFELRSREGRGRGREPLSQIRSRIGWHRHITASTVSAGSSDPDRAGDPKLFTVEEIIAIYARNEIKLTRDGAAYLAAIANLPGSGGLRTVTSIVGSAVLAYKATHRHLTEELLREMLATLDSDLYEVLSATLDAGTRLSRPAAKAG